MKIERKKLTESEIKESLKGVKGWKVADGKLTQLFKAKTYSEGVLFANAVAHIADSLDHHPEIEIGYQQVRVSVNTHDVKGISPWDFELAKRVDSIR